MKKNIEALDIASTVDNDNKTTIEKIKSSVKNGKNIIVITACTVGVVKTYIAKNELERIAKSLDYNIKVETHGLIGVKCAFSSTDIANADLVIIAVSAGVTNLNLERFNGKLLYQVEISKVIKNPASVITAAFIKAETYQLNKSKLDKRRIIKENKNKKSIAINKRIDELERKHLERLKPYPDLQKDAIESRNKWNKKYNFCTYLNEINSIDLQNQPATSKGKQNLLKI